MLRMTNATISNYELVTGCSFTLNEVGLTTKSSPVNALCLEGPRTGRNTGGLQKVDATEQLGLASIKSISKCHPLLSCEEG